MIKITKEEDYESLKAEFHDKLQALQKRCKHKKKEWIKIYWALGHSTGKEGLVCVRCNKVLKKRKLSKIINKK